MLAFADQAFAQMPSRKAALQIVLPPDVAGVTAFRRAADELQRYWQKICGEKPPVVSVPGAGARTIVFGKMPKRQDGCDAYALKSVAGGLSISAVNGRCALYAVYNFLERRGGCRWFWDGDVVPKGAAPRLDGLDENEVSRFPYRGIRYFAHRGLTRFQAEHWGPADWNRELDWCMKARVNTIMLRIGQDDLFQKAFPDEVPYPDPAKPIPEAMPGYNNRSLFWPLEYRGALRKQVLEAARDRGLIVPEDFGTMSHWYSRTPVAFLEKVKPAFLPQEGGEYGHPTDRVWDIRDKKWLDMYWKITEASIKNYGKAPPEVLHTVGLGERLCFTNRADNFRMKVQTLDRLVDYARNKYPSAQVAFASWDFYDAWKPQEVRDQIARLDPSKLLIWDYEADATEPGRSNFTEWNLVGKFPYTFGIFLCYEGGLDARADYRTIIERQKLIANDPFCKGYLFWPESSHTDTFLLRYFEANCWRADGPGLKPLLREFCRDRYGDQAPAFEAAWQCAIAVADAYDYGGCYASSIMPFAPWARRTLMHDTRDIELDDAVAAFHALSKADLALAFARRDAIDIARQLTDRLIAREQRRLDEAFAAWRTGASATDLERHIARYERLGALMADLLAQHTDYSLYDTFRRLDAVHPIANPSFGQVLIDNASCYYCRSHQYELARHWYLPVMLDRVQAMRKRLAAGDRTPFSYGSAFADELHAKLLKTPLDSMRPTMPRTAETLRKTLRALAETAGNGR